MRILYKLLDIKNNLWKTRSTKFKYVVVKELNVFGNRLKKGSVMYFFKGDKLVAEAVYYNQSPRIVNTYLELGINTVKTSKEYQFKPREETNLKLEYNVNKPFIATIDALADATSFGKGYRGRIRCELDPGYDEIKLSVPCGIMKNDREPEDYPDPNAKENRYSEDFERMFERDFSKGYNNGWTKTYNIGHYNLLFRSSEPNFINATWYGSIPYYKYGPSFESVIEITNKSDKSVKLTRGWGNYEAWVFAKDRKHVSIYNVNVINDFDSIVLKPNETRRLDMRFEMPSNVYGYVEVFSPSIVIDDSGGLYFKWVLRIGKLLSP